MLDNLISLLGIFVLLGLAWALSNNRRRFPWRVAGWGLGLQLILAVLLLRTPWGRPSSPAPAVFVTRLLAFTDAGASFLWGNLYRTSEDLVAHVNPEAGYIQVTDSVTGQLVPIGTVFVIHILPTIIFFSSLMALLYHLGVMQLLIRGMAWVMRKTMGTSGSESFSCAANVFVGQTEAPLVIRPYLPTMTQSELMAIMVGGFATVAGGVMAAYVRFGVDAGHLLAASVMSAPAALVVAKIMYPETEESPTRGTVTLDVPKEYANVLDAAAGGAGVGLKLAANIGAMLLAFIALVAMVNYGLGFVGLSLQQIFGWVFSPIAWVMGVPWSEAPRLRQPAGHQDRRQRIRGVHRAGHRPRRRRSVAPQRGHRHLRAVRIRQLLQHRHPDRRHRHHRPRTPRRRGRPRPEGHVRRGDRLVADRHHRRRAGGMSTRPHLTGVT